MIRHSNYENTVIKNCNPKGLPLREPIDTLINAVCLAMSISWEKSFKLLYAQAHKFCNIPSDKQCLDGMLDDLGFKKIKLGKGEHRLSPYDMLTLLDNRISDRDLVIMKLYWPERKTEIYTAICFRTFCGDYYHKLAAASEQHLSETFVKEVLVKNADTKLKEKSQEGYKRTKTDDIPLAEGSETLFAVNENPDGRRVGDCVLRGMAVCLDTDWHTVLDMIAEATDYAYPAFNRYGVFDQLLIQKGFEECRPFKKNGRTMNGDQFCKYIRDMYPEETVFLAEIGNDHVAAIKLLKDSYKIYDTWNSTNIRIPRFWVKYPEQKAERRPRKQADQEDKRPKPPTIREGKRLKHKIYGIGTIVSVDRSDRSCLVNIDFGSKGIKRLDEKWIINNCISVQQKEEP